MSETKEKKYKQVDHCIAGLPNGSFKVQKRIDGKVFQKTFRELSAAREFRDSLTKNSTPELENKTVEAIQTLSEVDTHHELALTKGKKQPKISKIVMSDIYEKNEKFMVIISRDRNILSSLIEMVG